MSIEGTMTFQERDGTTEKSLEQPRRRSSSSEDDVPKNPFSLAISSALFQKDWLGRLEPEHEQVQQVLDSRGILTAFFQAKDLELLKLHPQKLVVGDHDTMEFVFHKLGVSIRRDSYPVSVRQYLRRSVWQSTVKQIKRGLRDGLSQPIFVKPVSNTKLFTGSVLHGQEDLYKLHTATGSTRVWCSNVVQWQTEYRVFVQTGEIVGVQYYQGDDKIYLDMDVVRECINTFEASNESTVAYGIDFGVLLDTGETALVEWNDGFALGSYGLDPCKYTELLTARWQQAMAERNEA